MLCQQANNKPATEAYTQAEDAIIVIGRAYLNNFKSMDQVIRLQDEIETEVGKYNEMHKKHQQLIQARNNLYEQQSENSLVLREIKLLPQNSKIFKQVGGVLIDQNYKDVTSTLSQRIAHINSQIDKTTELLTKNEAEQNAMVEKIQKAKAFYTQMVQAIEQKR